MVDMVVGDVFRLVESELKSVIEHKSGREVCSYYAPHARCVISKEWETCFGRWRVS